MGEDALMPAHRQKPVLFQDDGCRREFRQRAAIWTLDFCDNITFPMEPHHHHHPGHAHPPATVSPSILRLSALERLAAAAVLIVALWGAVFWAMAS